MQTSQATPPTATPRSIKIAVMIIVWMGVCCLLEHLGLMLSKLRPSPMEFLIWLLVYIQIVRGLFRRRPIVYQSAILLGVFQIAQLILCWFVAIDRLYGRVPGWFPLYLYVSAILGVGLLASLLRKSSRDFIFPGKVPNNSAQ
jgi:hypothetical protein